MFRKILNISRFSLLLLALIILFYTTLILEAQQVNVNKASKEKHLTLMYTRGTEKFSDKDNIKIQWKSEGVSEIRIEFTDQF